MDNSKVDQYWYYTLLLGAEDFEMGLLKFIDSSQLAGFLANEEISPNGDSLDYIEFIKYDWRDQNSILPSYTSLYPKKEQAIGVESFVEKHNRKDGISSKLKKVIKDISIENNRLRKADSVFVKKLPSDSYGKLFSPICKFQSNIYSSVQYCQEEVASTLEALFLFDCCDPRLSISGLFEKTVKNSSGPLHLVSTNLNKSVKLKLGKLESDEFLFNPVTDYLFNFNVLLKCSLFSSEGNLVERVSNESHCTISDNMNKQVEVNRKIPVFAKAHDIAFLDHTYIPDGVKTTIMNEIAANYYLLVFAADWSGQWDEEPHQIAANYNQWKGKNKAVVLVSLATKTKDIFQFASPIPFVSASDFQRGDGETVSDFHVYGIPSFYFNA